MIIKQSTALEFMNKLPSMSLEFSATFCFHSCKPVVLLIDVSFHLLHLILEITDVILQEGHTNL